MRRQARLTGFLRLWWLLWGGRARQPQHPRVAASTSRPRVALAIQAACAAEATRTIPDHWAVYGWGQEPYQPAHGPFDARRAQAWQAIDRTLTELRAS